MYYATRERVSARLREYALLAFENDADRKKCVIQMSGVCEVAVISIPAQARELVSRMPDRISEDFVYKVININAVTFGKIHKPLELRNYYAR
jgi:hypothetical protein